MQGLHSERGSACSLSKAFYTQTNIQKNQEVSASEVEVKQGKHVLVHPKISVSKSTTNDEFLVSAGRVLADGANPGQATGFQSRAR
jgi:hypothetical protein